jgi:hypothetical protein
VNHESWTAAVKDATVASLLVKIKSDDSIDFLGKNECAKRGFCLFSTAFFRWDLRFSQIRFRTTGFAVSISHFVSVGVFSSFALAITLKRSNLSPISSVNFAN